MGNSINIYHLLIHILPNNLNKYYLYHMLNNNYCICNHRFIASHTQLSYYYHKYSDKIQNYSSKLLDLLNSLNPE